MWQIGLLIIAAHTGLFLIQVPQVFFLITRSRNPIDPWLPLGTGALNVYLWLLITPLVLWIGYRFPFSRGNFRKNLLLHFIFGILSGGIRHFIFTLGIWSLGFAPNQSLNSLFFSLPNFWASISTSLINYTVIVAIQQGYLHFRESQERAFRLQQAELEVLKMQLHPHFFFNTLNAISALIYRSPEDADRMITQLADLFRVSLQKDKAQVIPLKEELDILRAFLQIHQTLMGKRLQVEWKIEPETLDALVPNLILQPLAENAIQHGLSPLKEGGRITICAETQDGKLFLQVSDDGSGFGVNSNSRNDGIGLSNSRARLENLYGDGHKFSINERAGGGVTVKIEIPFREQITN